MHELRIQSLPHLCVQKIRFWFLECTSKREKEAYKGCHDSNSGRKFIESVNSFKRTNWNVLADLLYWFLCVPPLLEIRKDQKNKKVIIYGFSPEDMPTRDSSGEEFVVTRSVILRKAPIEVIIFLIQVNDSSFGDQSSWNWRRVILIISKI